MPPVVPEQVDLSPGHDERARNEGERVMAMMVPFFFCFMMFMGIFGTGQHMVTSVIEEKSNRVMELLLSSVSPLQLMAGKIIGLAGVGLTVMALWAAAAVFAARQKGIMIEVPPAILPYFAIYFVLGFLLFSAILAAIGSVCNTIKEAQGLLMPVSMLLVVPMVAWFNLVQSPNSALAVTLSFVPPVAPMVMMLRLCADPHLPLAQTLGSIALLAASVPAAIWAAGKIFRTGALMYGKRPTLREMFRWLRES